MVFLGYMRWDGVEIVNDERSMKYAQALGLPFSGFDLCTHLTANLAYRGWLTVPSEVGYQSVAADPAPWYEADTAASEEFIGMQLLDLQNIEASTRTLTIGEDANGGGTVNGQRRRPREWVIRALLMASSERGLDYGFGWLTTVLEYGDTCDVAVNPKRTISGAAQVDYLNTCMDRPEPTTTSPWRHLLDVWSLQPPSVLRRYSFSDSSAGDTCSGGAFMEIEFTATALNPGLWRDIIDFKDAGFGIDYAFLTGADGWDVYKNEATPPPIDDDLFQAPLVYGFPQQYSGLQSTIVKKASSPGGGALLVPLPVQEPVVPPGCAVLPGFPSPPQESVRCRAPYTGAYETYTYGFKDSAIPQSVPLAPVFQIRTAVGQTLDNMMIRLDYGGQTDVYQLEIDHIPENSRLKICSRQRRADIYSYADDEWSPAGHLLFTAGGAESFRYQEILCATGVVLNVDYPTENGNIYPAEEIIMWLGPRDA